MTSKNSAMFVAIFLAALMAGAVFGFIGGRQTAPQADVPAAPQAAAFPKPLPIAERFAEAMRHPTFTGVADLMFRGTVADASGGTITLAASGGETIRFTVLEAAVLLDPASQEEGKAGSRPPALRLEDLTPGDELIVHATFVENEQTMSATGVTRIARNSSSVVTSPGGRLLD